MTTASALALTSLARAESLSSWCHWFSSRRDLSPVLWFWIPWCFSVVLLSWLTLRRCLYLRFVRLSRGFSLCDKLCNQCAHMPSKFLCRQLQAVIHEYERRLPLTVPKDSASRLAVPLCWRTSCIHTASAVNSHHRCVHDAMLTPRGASNPTIHFSITSECQITISRSWWHYA